MLHIICALNCEARPLIRELRLQNQNLQGPFAVYSGDEVRLIISGMGRLAASAACAYLAGRYPEPQVPAWLNFGIGGARSLSVGEGRWAHRINDNISGQVYYPGLSLKLPILSSEITSVEQALTEYPNADAIYDMEAAGFYAMASAFSPSELISCIKIISDNAEHSQQQIDKSFAEALIGQQLPALSSAVEQLNQHQQDYEQQRDHAEVYLDLLQRFRFSYSQRTQLKRLLFRWQALLGEPTAAMFPTTQFRSSKDLLQFLEARLSDQSIPITHLDGQCFLPSI